MDKNNISQEAIDNTIAQLQSAQQQFSMKVAQSLQNSIKTSEHFGYGWADPRSLLPNEVPLAGATEKTFVNDETMVFSDYTPEQVEVCDIDESEVGERRDLRGNLIPYSFGLTNIKAEGSAVGYDSNTVTNFNHQDYSVTMNIDVPKQGFTQKVKGIIKSLIR